MLCEQIEYTKYVKIAEEQLLLLEERYLRLNVDRYVIMPNHIYVVLIISKEAAGACSRHTVIDIVCAYKSLPYGQSICITRQYHCHITIYFDSPFTTHSSFALYAFAWRLNISAYFPPSAIRLSCEPFSITVPFSSI